MKGQWRDIQITNINFKAKTQDLNIWKGEGWVVGVLAWVRTQVELFFFFFWFYCRKAMGLYVWACVSVLFPRIEPVGKPYREVCLQTKL